MCLVPILKSGRRLFMKKGRIEVLKRNILFPKHIKKMKEIISSIDQKGSTGSKKTTPQQIPPKNKKQLPITCSSTPKDKPIKPIPSGPDKKTPSDSKKKRILPA